MLLATLLVAASAAQAPQSYDFVETAHLPDDVRSFSTAAIADFDGNGTADLVLAVGGLRLFLNHGRLDLREVSGQVPGGIHPTSITPADVDGDGDVDLVVTTLTAPGVVVLTNDGTGRFTVRTGAVPSSSRSGEPVVDDLDGDGDVDIAFVVVPTGSRFYLNDGTGTFTDASARMPQVPFAQRLRAGDFDQDGDVDLIVLRTGSNLAPRPVTQLVNDGSGRFTEVPARMPGAQGTLGEVADVDLDGDLDLVMVELLFNPFSMPHSVLLNDGAGTFTNAGARGLPPGLGETTLGLFDADGDGAVDVMTFDFRGTELLLNQGNGFFAAPSNTDLVPVGVDEVLDVTIGDLDGDRDLDLLCASRFQGRMLINLDRGRMTHAIDRNLPLTRVSGRTAQFADVDRDGLDDLLALEVVGQGAVLFRNTGDGTMLPDQRFPTVNATPSAATFADLTGDGLPELILAIGGQGGQDQLFVNHRGALSDLTSGWMPQVTDVSFDVAAGDLNGDRANDLVFRTTAGLKILLNGGQGPMAPGGSVPAIARSSFVEIGDVDGDGSNDLFLGRTLLLNDGTGTFRDASNRVPQLNDVIADGVLFDFDGDGDLDAYIARTGFGHAGGQDVLLENRGGTFVDVTLGRLPIALDQALRVRAHDLDGDGDTDLLVDANRNDKVLINDGAGSFTRGVLRFPNTATPSSVYAAGDVDGDGDADLLWNTRIVRNLDVQLVARHLPLAGDPWDIEFHLAGGGVAAAVIGPYESRIPIRGVGTLRVNPLGAIDLPAVTVPGVGAAIQTIPIPASAQLIGTELFLQAITVRNDGRARLTNLLDEVIH